MKISFVLPIYNEQDNINLLWNSLQDIKLQIAKKHSQIDKFEFIFINDGSKDNSLEILKQIYQEFSDEVKILSFGRNHGHQLAVTAGQDYATGDAIIIMDTDMQDPPNVCLELIDKWLDEKIDIVYAKRSSYTVPAFKKVSAFVFYRLLKKIANLDIPEDTGDFRLLSKRVNDEMKKYKEKNRYLRGISFLTGYKASEVLFKRAERYAGKPVYTFSKSLKLALDGITSFSVFPLKLVTMTGIFMSFLSIILGIIYVIYSMQKSTAVGGWSSLMLVVVFIGGIQLFMLGIIGEYIGRIFTEAINRPIYTVTEKYE